MSCEHWPDHWVTLIHEQIVQCEINGSLKRIGSLKNALWSKLGYQDIAHWRGGMSIKQISVCSSHKPITWLKLIFCMSAWVIQTTLLLLILELNSCVVTKNCNLWKTAAWKCLKMWTIDLSQAKFDRNEMRQWGTELQWIQWIVLLFNNILIVQLTEHLSEKTVLSIDKKFHKTI